MIQNSKKVPPRERNNVSRAGSPGLRTGRITCSQTPGKMPCGAGPMVFLIRGKSLNSVVPAAPPEALLDLPAAWEPEAPEVYGLLLDKDCSGRTRWDTSQRRTVTRVVYTSHRTSIVL